MSTLFTEVNGLLTLFEMNPELREYLQNAINHYADTAVHLSATDKENLYKAVTALTTSATSSSNGMMSKEDKIKLDTIDQGANNYVHPEQSALDTTRYYSSIKVNSTGHIVEGYETEGFVEANNGTMSGNTTAENITTTNLTSTNSTTLNTTTINGLTTLNGTTNVNGTLNILGELGFSGSLAYDDMSLKTLYVNEGITSTGNDSITNANITTLNGTNANITTLDVTNGTIISGSISTLSSTDITSDKITALTSLTAKAITVESDITVGGKLNLSQPISYDDFYANTATINQSITVPTATITTDNITTANIGTLKVTASAEVDADASFLESVNITKNLGAYGDTTLKDTTINGTLSVSGDTTIGGSLLLNGEIDTTNSKSVINIGYLENSTLQNVIQSGESPEVQTKLWYDTSGKELYYYNGTKWVSLTDAAAGTGSENGTIMVSSEYKNPYECDVWIDSANNKLYYTKDQSNWTELTTSSGSSSSSGGISSAYQVADLEPTLKTSFWIKDGELRYYNDDSWKNLIKDPISTSEDEPDQSQLWLTSEGLKYYNESTGWSNVVDANDVQVYEWNNDDSTKKNVIQIYYNDTNGLSAIKVLLDENRITIGNNVLLQMDEENASYSDISKKQMIIDSNALIKAYDEENNRWRVISDVANSKPIISENRYDMHPSILIDDDNIYFRDNKNLSSNSTTTRYIHPPKCYDVDTLTSNNNLLIRDGKLYYDGGGTWEEETTEYPITEVNSISEAIANCINVFSGKFFVQKRLALIVDSNLIETIESEEDPTMTDHNAFYIYATNAKVFYYDAGTESFISSTYHSTIGDYDWIFDGTVLYDNRYKSIDFRYKDNSNTYYNPSDVSKLNKDDTYITKDDAGYHLFVYHPNMVELNTGE